MAGVAGPMWLRRRSEALRFLLGLSVGGVVAGAVLGVPIYLVGELAAHIASRESRELALAAVAITLGAMDLAGRTLHVWRQVPQQLVRSLSPGALGLTWGFDLGLQVTTQKTSSLIWLSIAAVAVLRPISAPAFLGVLGLLGSLGIATLSVTTLSRVMAGGLGWDWVRRTRWATGTVMLTLGLNASGVLT